MSQSESGQAEIALQMLSDPALGARPIELSAGAVLYEPSSPATHIYLIQQGEFRIYQVSDGRTTRLLDIEGPGKWIGNAALGGLAVQGKRAVAESSSVVWAVPVDNLLAGIGQHSKLAVELLVQLARRLQDAAAESSQLIFDDCEGRLVKALVRFSHSPAATTTPEGDVILRMTHEQLAQAVGAARETVSVTLTQLRRRNLLRTGRNRLIYRPEALSGEST